LKQTINQYRIALLILDSAVSNHAVGTFIEKHQDDILLVIASNPFRKQAGGMRRLLRHYHCSGARFSLYLVYNFFIFPLILKIHGLYCKLLGKTCRHLPVRERCRRYGIDYHVSDDINHMVVSGLVRERQIDLIVTCFFDQILGAELIKAPRRGCLNMHPGLLPECRGVFPEFHVAAGNGSTFGITIHCIDDATIDTGRIVVKKPVDIKSETSMLNIGRKLLAEGVAVLDGVLARLDNHLASTVQQGTGAYYSFPSRADIGRIKGKGYKLLGITEVIRDIIPLFLHDQRA
jgi:folate-dependent phosphoribosylglycinamide formyltransferase PurN